MTTRRSLMWSVRAKGGGSTSSMAGSSSSSAGATVRFGSSSRDRRPWTRRSMVWLCPKRRRIRARSASSPDRSTTGRAGGTSRRPMSMIPRSRRCSPRSTMSTTCSSVPTSLRSGSAVPIVGKRCSPTCCVSSRRSSPAPCLRPKRTCRGKRLERDSPTDAHLVRPRTVQSNARGASSAPPITTGSSRHCRRRKSLSARSRRGALADSEPDVAFAAWEQLLSDSSRSVRRATVDAMVDAERDGLRPLLERALLDADAWIRWKALVGLVALGVETEPRCGHATRQRHRLPREARNHPRTARRSPKTDAMTPARST